MGRDSFDLTSSAVRGVSVIGENLIETNNQSISILTKYSKNFLLVNHCVKNFHTCESNFILVYHCDTNAHTYISLRSEFS
jgi:hypothetical protein